MSVNWLLKSSHYEKPFKLMIDSSDVGTGSVLVQEASDGLDHPVGYFSKNFLKYKKNHFARKVYLSSKRNIIHSH